MMMNSGNWEGNAMGGALGYTTVEMLLDDVSKQMASSDLTRYSRGSNGQKTGGSMRIVKPNSNSNSPRGSLGRRRTVMDNGAYRRRLAMIEQQNALAAGGYVSNDGLLVPSQRSVRPVSWHPGYQGPQLASQQAYYPTPQLSGNDFNQYDLFNVPQTPAVFSNYGSPDSEFSPSSMPAEYTQQQEQLYQVPSSYFQTTSDYTPSLSQQTAQAHQAYFPPSTDNMDPTMYSHFDWNNFATHGFEHATSAPPTPENFLPVQHPEPFPAEEAIQYQPLSEPDSDEEELIGMGLYDTPDTGKSLTDPSLDNYRSLMSQLMGSGRKSEPTGKGLKLEETWEPPPSDDEDEEDGESEDDETAKTGAAPVHQGRVQQPQTWL